MMENVNLRHLFGQAVLTFGRQIVSIVCQMAFVVLLARVLGPEAYGKYALAVLLPFVLGNLLNLGVSSANVYFIGRGSVSVTTAFAVNLRLWLVLVLLGFTASFVIVGGYSLSLFPGVPNGLLWGGAAIFPIILLAAFLSSLLQGKQDFHAYNTALIFPPVISLVAAAGLVWWLHLGEAAALMSMGFGQLVGLLASAWFLKPHRREKSPADPPATRYARDCLGFGLKAHASNVMSFLNYRADIFLVNLFLNPAGAGVYVVAVQIAERLWLFSQAVSTVLFPRLSELHTDEEARKQLTPLVARWVTYAGFLFAIVLALVVKPLVVLLFGQEYEEAALVLLCLLPGIVVFNCARVLANDIAARGRPELNIWTAGITLVVNLIGNIVLIRRYGIIGAALATTISYSLASIVNILIYTRLSGNHWWRPLVPEREDRRLLGLMVANLKRKSKT